MATRLSWTLKHVRQTFDGCQLGEKIVVIVESEEVKSREKEKELFLEKIIVYKGKDR